MTPQVHVDIRSESSRKGLCRRDALARLACHVCEQEGLSGEFELSVLLCDDLFMQELNRRYRGEDRPTDVLSFPQETPASAPRQTLGDVVISIETVERRCGPDQGLIRRELRLLFCHGLLHLVGYEHQTPEERAEMIRRQAQYLGVSEETAWWDEPKAAPRAKRNAAQ